jgi:ATP-dependent DNA helicase RecG
VLQHEDVIVRAREEAHALVSVDPGLVEHPALRATVRAVLESEQAEYLEKT